MEGKQNQASKGITITALQKLGIELFNDRDTVEILFGGSGGGGKSVLIGILALLRCIQYPGVREGIGRKDLSQLKKTTFTTLLGKVHTIMGIGLNDFRQAQDGSIHYTNGSTIVPIELDYYPSDPDFNRLGSLELTDMFIDEVGELREPSYNAIKSRVGRWLNDKYGLTPKLFCTCNPSMTFVREYFYEPYSRLGGGQIQRWQTGKTESRGEILPAYRAFVRSSVYDNPFIEKSYVYNLQRLPDRERKRLLDGNWDYADDSNSLFRMSLLDKAITYDYPQESDFDKFIGVDVSDKGGDATVFSLIDHGVLITQKQSSVQLNWDSKSELPLSRLIADELVEFAQRNGFTQRNAKNIAVECNGVGVGVRDMLKTRGWFITEYTATHKSRSEGYYNLMLDLDDGSVKIVNDLLGLDELRRELSAHTYEMNNQEPNVIRKDKIKMAIGHSPDFADSFMIANTCRREFHSGAKDVKNFIYW